MEAHTLCVQSGMQLSKVKDDEEAEITVLFV